MAPGDDPVWGDLGEAFPAWQASGRDAILQPRKPEIIPSARILQRTFALGAIGGAGVSVQLAPAGRAVASTGSATEKVSQSGIL